MIDDGGKIPLEWTSGCALYPVADFAAADETGSHFGVYDSEYSFFLALPESMHGSVCCAPTGMAAAGWVQPRGYHSLLRTAPDRTLPKKGKPGHRRGTD